MRVRVRLDQQRLASMLQGLSPAALGSQFADVTSGMLDMLGDMASLSFAPYTPGQQPLLGKSDVNRRNAQCRTNLADVACCELPAGVILNAKQSMHHLKAPMVVHAMVMLSCWP